MDLRPAPLDLAAAEPHLPAPLRPLARRLDLRVSHGDGMESDDVHYLSVGASALNVIRAALCLAGVPEPGSVLDFGSGAGRVTRWIKAAYPGAVLSCCDLRPGDVAFCRAAFGAEAWASSADIDAIAFRGPHDLIWMGSVLTHLDEDGTRRLVDRAMAALRPGGLLVASTSGRAARAVQDGDGSYLEGDGWPSVKRGYDEDGYGYVDYPAGEGFEPGYGISLSSPAWLTRLATAFPGRRLVMLAEGVWDGNGDVVALQVAPEFAPDRDVPGPEGREAARLRDRVAGLEGSTSWRLTAPMRRIAAAMKAAGRG